jgi:hypothetical protein
MYIVISIPNRKSIACGVSQIMPTLLICGSGMILCCGAGRANPQHHETRLMIFMSPAGARGSRGAHGLHGAPDASLVT